jgi:multidrug efflux pump subunit AcrB
MDFRNISAWSIRNPVVPIVLFLGLLLAGVVSFSRMEVSDKPDIDFPGVRISIVQPGAAPEEVETQITQLVDSALQSLNGVSNISSTASEGNNSTFVEFEIGTDVNQAVNDVKNAIDTIRGDLPDGILEPRVNRIDVGGGAALAYFSVEASDMTLEQLSWFVDDSIAKRLLGVPGMATVTRGGGVDREIRVIVNPERMQSLGVTATQLNNAIRQVNADAGGGQAEIAGSRQSVRVLGNAETAHALSETRIPISDGRIIKLQDVATVSDSYGEQNSINKIGEKQVVTFGFQRAKGASDVTVYDGAVEALEKIKAENPGIKFTRVFSVIDYTKSQYRSSIASMVEGALLAVVVVFLFLRDWRATIISAIAIPLSAIPAFWFMDLLGFSLNTMSLLALGLVAGVLVDDAIVEIENIVRHMRMGKSAYQASIDAADEIGLAVVATTFSIVAVFLPVGLMPGVSGVFFKNFGLTVVVAVLMSLAVARMISPMIAAYFMKSHGEEAHATGPMMERYIRMLEWTLYNRWKMVAVGVIGFIVMIGMFFVIPSQLFPSVNFDFSIAKVEMVPGTTLQQTEAKVREITKVLQAQPDVELALQSIHEGDANVFLALKKTRPRTSQQFERDMALEFEKISDARISFVDTNTPGGGGTGRPITVMLSGSDSKLLAKTAATLVEQMKKLPGVVAPRISADMKRPEIVIRPRSDLAAQLGVTTLAISQTIRIATLGEIDQNSAKFSLEDRQIPIRVMLSETSRQDLNTIRNLPVQTAKGGSVPLSRVADISFGSGPTSIQRYNQSRRILVGADLAQGVLKGDIDKLIANETIMVKLPEGVTNAAVGSDAIQKELFSNFPVAVISGVLLVFGVLVLLYQRFMAPLVNMASLTIAPLGGLLLLWIVGKPLSMPVLIGSLMLIGIVSKNSILLIDFTLDEMSKGIPKFDALMDAGRKRAQPIVMTTVAMVAGMIPTAISVSGDGAWRAPMGVVVIGGLIVSTIMTLALVPAAFSLADDIEKWVGQKVGRKLLAEYDDPTPVETKPKDQHPPAAIAGGAGMQPAE